MSSLLLLFQLPADMSQYVTKKTNLLNMKEFGQFKIKQIKHPDLCVFHSLFKFLQKVNKGTTYQNNGLFLQISVYLRGMEIEEITCISRNNSSRLIYLSRIKLL